MDEPHHPLLGRLRIVATALIASIVVIALASEYLLRSGALASSQGLEAERGALRTVWTFFVLIAAGLVTLAQLMKRAVVAGAPQAIRTFVKALIRNLHRRSGGYGPSVILIPIALSEAVAVLGLVLLVLSGGRSRLQAYILFLVALASALSASPGGVYEQRLIEMEDEVRRE